MDRSHLSATLLVLALATARVAAATPPINALVCGVSNEPSVALLMLTAEHDIEVGAIVAEVEARWKPYGVRFRWEVPALDAQSLTTADLVVAVDDSPPGSEQSDRTPIAHVRFYAGQPRNFIRASVPATMLLVNFEKRRMGFRESSPRLGGFVARVLGRAIAHEIGHVLLGTSTHSPTGLMRATHSGLALMTPDGDRFALTASDQRQLRARLAAGPVDCANTTLVARREEH